MGKIFLTSDCHFNHSRILEYEASSRPFETVKDMNEAIIRNWNSIVSPDDTVYVLGDFFMGLLTDIENILSRLIGKIILVRGNHDTKSRLEFYKTKGIEIKEIEYLSYKGKFFALCHFPIGSEEFARMITENNTEVIWCYGHVHHNAPKGYSNGSFHVGMDTNGLTPIALEEIWRQSNWAEDSAHCLCDSCRLGDTCFIKYCGTPTENCEYYSEQLR